MIITDIAHVFRNTLETNTFISRRVNVSVAKRFIGRRRHRSWDYVMIVMALSSREPRESGVAIFSAVVVVLPIMTQPRNVAFVVKQRGITVTLRLNGSRSTTKSVYVECVRGSVANRYHCTSINSLLICSFS